MIYTILAVLYFLGPVVGLWFIFKKSGQAPWKAIVPVYNIVVWIKVCRKDWKWYIYFLVPAINIFTYLLLVVETAKVFKRNSLLEQTVAVIVPFIYLPYLGLSHAQYSDGSEQRVKNSSAREWAEAIIFALVAAVIIRGNVFELYNIPSSSMEKSLLIGDYLMVSKMAYGPRAAMTPLSFPLVHNVLPLSGGKVESYLKWIKMPYHRYPGRRNVERFDATVFNYPDGDTVCTAFQSNRSYHDLVREYGRDVVQSRNDIFGKIVVRPVDKRENFIKRCIGLPGETLEIQDRQVLVNGNSIENPDQLQFTYAVRMKESLGTFAANMSQMGMYSNDIVGAKFQKDCSVFTNIGVSGEDCSTSIGYYNYVYLTNVQLETALKYSDNLQIEPLTAGNDSVTMVRISPKYSLVDEQGSSRRVEKSFQNMCRELETGGVTNQALSSMGEYYTLPLTADMAAMLSRSDAVEEVIPIISRQGYSGLDLFPHSEGFGWSVDNFGPITIPAKGMTVELTPQNMAIYRRAIEVYEGNMVTVDGNQILINGEAAETYTFKMDYYWMMGDNRHNSADSRYWGFVPENHVVGRAAAIVFSRDKENRSTRWNRLFKTKL